MKIFFLKLQIALLIFITLWGCAASPVKKPASFVFFPPLPEQPRIQFLTSISVESDFISPKSSFADFIIGRKKNTGKKILKPYGVAIKDGIIYVCDTDLNSIHALDIPGQKFRRIGGKKTVEFKKPVNITIDTDGNKYIADTIHKAVIVLDEKNNFKGMYGKNELKKPTGVAVFGNKLFVADVTGNEVVVFEKNSGDLLGRIGKPKDGSMKLEAPTNIATDKDGNIYVSETMGWRIKKLTQEGELLKVYGSGLGDAHGQFSRPRGIDVDHEGRLYSVDAMHSVVQIFDNEGNLLLFFGEIGNNRGNLSLPAQVVVDYENVSVFQKYAAPDFKIEYLIIVTSQYGNRKINIFGFGHREGLKGSIGRDNKESDSVGAVDKG